MKGGAEAAERTFNDAVTQAGLAPLLQEAYVAALARAGAIPQVCLTGDESLFIGG